jgi:outer membrane protein assembly factor BamA
MAQEESRPDTLAAADTTSPGNSLVPLPVIFYQPETGLGFGVTASYFIRNSQAEESDVSRQQSSFVAPVAIYTTKKQIIISARTELYPSQGRYRVLGEVAFIKFPTKFWGIGNNTPEALEEDYTPQLFGLSGEFQKEVAPGWYAGVTVRFAYREITEVEEGGLLETGQVPGQDDGSVVGLGLVFARDTRSSTVYPRSGSYHQLRGALYNGFFGSAYDFGVVTLDLRKYFPLFTTHVLAMRGLGIAAPGSPPFDLMPQLGGEELLRGYFAGRFRDRDLLAFQLEYRLPVWWRFGAVGFAAAGQVAHELASFEIGEFHPAAGFGIRFLLSEEEGMNIRADFAWGFDVESSGFYLSFGEAF